jgi:hypothetical protein
MPKGQLEQNPFIGMGVVFVVGAILSFGGWIPLGLPARLIGSFVPTGTCTQYQVNTVPMFWCSVAVALQYLAGPIILMVILFLIRQQIANAVKAMIPKVPVDYLFLLAPAAATIVFTMTWAPAHAGLESASGFVPQMIFPALVGVYTYTISRFGGSIQQNLKGLFDFRDSVPKFIRILAMFAVPLIFGKLSTMGETYITQVALKEQTAVLLCMVLGYFALAPRQERQSA